MVKGGHFAPSFILISSLFRVSLLGDYHRILYGFNAIKRGHLLMMVPIIRVDVFIIFFDWRLEFLPPILIFIVSLFPI